MVPLTPPAPTAKEKYLRVVEKELVEFERREREFTRRERREQAAQLGLPIFGLPGENRPSQYEDRVV